AVRAVMGRAAATGVAGVCTVGDGIAEAELALQAAHADERVVAACAVHPTKADELTGDVRDRLRELVADPRCVAVGETGLDTYWITHDPGNTASLDVQEEALRWHMDLAAEVGKPLMIHNREADGDLMRVLADAPAELPVMLHCFSSPLEVAREAVGRGYYLSFCGNVTFKRNEELRQAAALVPSDRLLVETDAPYMMPEPYRGSRNEPAYVGYTARCVAEARGMDAAELGELATANARRLYGI
ncbi:TatD family hydrolase, partial [Corynebacterium sp.]|uniref:TatD family hydrolase n=1 Tax=Corynebacterium sp. TaxID=1720 RepID=UPI002649D51F